MWGTRRLQLIAGGVACRASISPKRQRETQRAEKKMGIAKKSPAVLLVSGFVSHLNEFNLRHSWYKLTQLVGEKVLSITTEVLPHLPSREVDKISIFRPSRGSGSQNLLHQPMLAFILLSTSSFILCSSSTTMELTENCSQNLSSNVMCHSV